MRLTDLIGALSEVLDAEGDRPVLLAHQPSWPLAETIAGIVPSEDTYDPEDDPGADPGDQPVWIVAGGHPDNRSPYAPSHLWDLAGQGW